MPWIENGYATHEFTCDKTKKNIFLIGDSIRCGYCETVKNELMNDAKVFYLKDNCRSSQYVIFSMKGWAGKFDDASLVDIVYFNCGHWDVAHWSGDEESLTSESEYERNIKMVIRRLRKFFPNAKLIFSTTSPMNPSGRLDTNPRTNEEINRYNAIATEVSKSEGLDIHDINAFMRDFGSECFVDSVHLTPESFERLGVEVARFLKSQF